MEYLPKNFNNPIHRVAVFGGSFDPPTLGHQSVIEQVITQVDEVVLVPSLAHAFGKKLTPLPIRLQMLTLFIQDLVEKYPNFENKIHVLNIEPDLIHLHSTGYVYTYDVLDKVEKLFQQQNKTQSTCQIEINFVIGPDLADPNVFNRFYRANDILKKWSIILVEQMLSIRSTYVREYLSKKALSIPSDELIMHLHTMLGPRLTEDIIANKRYYPDSPLLLETHLFSQIKIKLDLAIFSIQQNNLCLLVDSQISQELPYGLIDTQEDKQLEDALNRSILEKLGQLPGYYEQVITQGARKNDKKEWWLSITYFCLISTVQLPHASMCHWVKIDDFIEQTASLAQKNSLMLCVERLKNKASYTSIPCYFALEPFTLSDLQKVYEIVLGYKLEKKSFRRRFIDSGLLEDTGQIRKANHRPAQLYKLKDKSHTPYYFTRVIEGSRS